VSPAEATNEGGKASPLAKRRGRGGGAAGSTAAAIRSAASTPTRASKKSPPGHMGAPPTPEEMDGLDDDVELHFEPYTDTPGVEQDGQTNSHGVTEVLHCLYENLLDIAKPAKTRMTDGSERARTSSEIEEDAQQVEKQLLALTPPPQDFCYR
jgi:hypothetical protein